MPVPLAPAAPAECGLRTDQLERLAALIERHIGDGRHPGAQVAIARHGRLVFDRTFGAASVTPPASARPDTLWLLYSNTKVITAAGLWLLAEQGALRFTDRIADHVPEFARNGKGEITVLQLMTHQAGFPSATIPKPAWTDHELLRRVVSDIGLEWTPGSRFVYHPSAAHWTAAVLIEALTGQDYRRSLRDALLAPLGLDDDLMLGVPEAALGRCADMLHPDPQGYRRDATDCEPDFRMAGTPGGGGFGTARGLAAFYQMILAGGALGGRRVLSPRTLAYALRDWTPGKTDPAGIAVHRAIGPYLRGSDEPASGLGAFAAPATFGHGGAGSSIAWGDPDSGVSFAYVTNCLQVEPWHSRRMDTVCNLVHAAIL